MIQQIDEEGGDKRGAVSSKQRGKEGKKRKKKTEKDN